MPKVGSTPAAAIRPYWTTRDGKTARLFLGNVLDVLRGLPSQSVQCAVTSPPYWGLRSYATGDSKHEEIGCEKTPEEFVAKMVAVFREVRRVLRDDGMLWLNLGDTYFRDGLAGVPWRVALALQADGWVLRQDIIWHKPSPMPESVTNRCTKAHEYLFLLTKRPRYFYDAEAIKEQGGGHRTGGAMNYKSSNGIREYQGQNTEDTYQTKNKRSVWTVSSQGYAGAHFATFPPKLITPCVLAGTSERGCCTRCGAPWRRVVQEKKLKRDRPNDYVKRMGEEGTGNSCANSVAGVESSTLGWYPTCGCDSLPTFPPPTGKRYVQKEEPNGDHFRDKENDRERLEGVTDSESYATWVGEAKRLCVLSERISTVPCVVLDPFVGSGTTVQVALECGQRGWGIDLSKQYLDRNAIPRVEGALLAEERYRGQVVREARKVDVGKRLF